MASAIEMFRQAAIHAKLLPKTRKDYAAELVKFFKFVNKPASQWSPADVRRWLIHLHDLRYSGSSRSKSLCAVKFFFVHVLKLELGQLDLPPMPRPRQTLRTIPTVAEIGRLFAGMKGLSKTMAQIMFGSGLRVGECCKLRVQDVDIENLTVRVWDAKGFKSRLTILPESLVPALQRHIAMLKALHDQDLAAGGGLVELPDRMAIKYKNANREFRQQWFFPSTIVHGQYRWHATRECVGKAMRAALKNSGIYKHITPHTLRHAFVTYGLRCGNDIKRMMDLVGHYDANTTMIYTHADAAIGVSPMDCAIAPCALVGAPRARLLEAAL